MPNHVISFELPEEHEELNLVMKAADMHLVINDLYQWLRALRKYDMEGFDSNTIDAVWHELFRIADDHDVNVVD